MSREISKRTDLLAAVIERKRIQQAAVRSSRGSAPAPVTTRAKLVEALLKLDPGNKGAKLDDLVTEILYKYNGNASTIRTTAAKSRDLARVARGVYRLNPEPPEPA